MIPPCAIGKDDVGGLLKDAATVLRHLPHNAGVSTNAVPDEFVGPVLLVEKAEKDGPKKTAEPSSGVSSETGAKPSSGVSSETGAKPTSGAEEETAADEPSSGVSSETAAKPSSGAEEETAADEPFFGKRSVEKDLPPDHLPTRTEEKESWFYYLMAIGVVFCLCSAGIFSGLTMGLVSIDPVQIELLQRIDLNEVEDPGEVIELKAEKNYAVRVQPLLEDHHRLLVTLLFCNAIACETLPLLMDNLGLPQWANICVSVGFLKEGGSVFDFGPTVWKFCCGMWGFREWGRVARGCDLW